MTPSIRLEGRFAALVAAIIGAYALIVTAVAAEHGQFALVANWHFTGMVGAIWISAFAFVFILYAIDLVVRRRPARPIGALIDDLRTQVLRPDLMLARATILLGFFGMMVLFGPFKIMLGNVQGFPFDAALMQADRALFLGTDPWRITHALIGPIGTFVLHIGYNTWFIMMWLSMIYFMLRPERVRERAHYVVAFLLTWIIVGSFAAWALASAGPCFYERAFGDPYYAPLMARLVAIDAELKTMGLGIWGLELQDALWNSYAAKRELFGGGISAMPSVHVAVAAVMALGARRLDRRLGWALVAFTAAIWVGSVHLAWHYAVDGLVAIGLTLAIWKLSGWLVARYVLAAPRADAAVALA